MKCACEKCDRKDTPKCPRTQELNQIYYLRELLEKAEKNAK